MQTSINIDVTWVVCDASGCPRFEFDLTPSGWTNKRPGSPGTYGRIVIPIDPITVLLMPPNLLTESEIATLGYPPALVSTLALLKPR